MGLGISRLGDKNIFCELWKMDGLIYAVLNNLGQNRIAEHYKKKYDVKINVVERNPTIDDDEEYYFRQRILNIYHNLQDHQAQGLVYTSRSPGSCYTEVHAYPYIVGKKGKDMIELDFTYQPPRELPKGAKDYQRRITPGFPIDIKKSVYNFDNRGGYKNGGQMVFQRDGFSCATIALNTLKNALTSEEFMEEFFGDNFTTLSLRKTKMAQGSEEIKDMSEEDKAKYVREIDGKKYNLKAFYKAHYYARLLDPKHMDYLDDFNRQIIEDIDRVRAEYKKEKKGLQLLVPPKKVISEQEELLDR